MKKLLILLSLFSLLNISNIKSSEESKEEKEVKEYKEYSKIQKITKNFPDTHHFLKKLLEKKRIPAVLLPTIMSFCKSNYFKYHQTLNFSNVGHFNRINALLIELDDTHFISGSDDCTIKIWQLIPSTSSTSAKWICIQTLDQRNGGHFGCINSLMKLDDNHFASGSADKKIKIWELIPGKTPKCIQILDESNDGHTNWVNSLTKLDDNHFASGSNDNTIKIWQLIPETASTPTVQYRFIQTLDHANGGHTNCVLSLMKFDETHFVSGSFDRTIKIWELIPSTDSTLVQCRCIQTLNLHNGGHTNWVNSLMKLDETHFVSGSYDETIKIWELIPDSTPIQYRCIHTLDQTNDGHTDWIKTLTKLDDNHFVSGSTDRTIKIWEFIPATASTPLQCRCIQTLIIDNAAPMSLVRMSSGDLIVGRTDGAIQVFKPVLDISAKKHIRLSDIPQESIFSTYLFIKNNRNKILMLMAALYFIKNRKQIINYLPHLLKYFKPLT